MLDIKFIRENVDAVKKNTKSRLADVDIDELLEVDKKRRELESAIDNLRAKRNAASKTKPTSEIITEMKSIGDQIGQLENELAAVSLKFREMLMMVPNMSHPEVAISANEDDNPVLEIIGKIPKFNFEPKDHVELAEKLDLIDFDRATKIAGAKFYYLKNELALMEFALVQYALDLATNKGFIPFSTPDLAKREILEGLGYNPRGESTQIYNVENTDLSLIGTAEITMGGYHKDEIIDGEHLPKKYVAVSHCYRTEAGSYSKFSKGIFRVHQFTKVEMFQYTLPEKSEEAHRELLEIEKEIFSGLGLTYRVIDHCTADLGAPSYRTFDLEAWMPGKPNKDGGMGDWAEITSTSNCTDYQSRALNIKYKDKDGKKDFLHTLNGTAIAISRALIAIMENNQQADGSITIPKALQKYLPKGLTKISR
ncbi:MAG: Serine--tRNA ligase [Parcubacteria group bacterium ADurb.Bin316]|nr:MAG: Serine--tRNA ligase [Parcubacteria group bacterium ADurb.Bin316]HOZ56349.1 serine--tRNA ligase [bacterium]